MVFDSKLADRIKSRCNRMLDRALPDVPKLEKQENWGALGGVIKGACRDALQLAMIEMRVTGELDKALGYLKKVRGLFDSFDAVPNGKIEASILEIPIYCCLLLGDIDKAKRLSLLVLKADMVPGSYFDIHAQILSAFVLDDSQLAEKWEQEFDGLKKGYW